MTMIYLLCLLLAEPPCPSGSTLTTVTLTGGIADDFSSSGNEPTTQSTYLAQFTGDNTPFDYPYYDRKFGHTLSGISCTAQSAVLTLVIQARNGLAHNDTIGLQATGNSSPVFLWSNSIKNLTGLSWNTVGQTTTLTLDLQALPLASGGSRDILADVAAAGYLDIYLQDDTSVDSASLRVQSCMTDDCNKNNIDDSCEAVGVFQCPQDVVATTESGLCGSLISLNATYENACQQSSYTITNDIDPAQGGNLRYLFPTGNHTVTFTLYPSDGPPQTCVVNVTVNDVTPPTILFCPRLK